MKEISRFSEEKHKIAEISLCGMTAICDPSGALFLPEIAMLIVSDLHLEKGSSFARHGQFIPPYDTGETLDMLANVIERYRPKTVVSLGDSFHDMRASARLPVTYLDRLKTLAHNVDWFWITGNHDPLHPSGLAGDTLDELTIGNVILRHEPCRNARTGEISGHLHPGARIIRSGQSVHRPCFICDGNRIIMPAFGAFTGTLNVCAPAFNGLFHLKKTYAYMLGQGKVYRIAYAALHTY